MAHLPLLAKRAKSIYYLQSLAVCLVLCQRFLETGWCFWSRCFPRKVLAHLPLLPSLGIMEQFWTVIWPTSQWFEKSLLTVLWFQSLGTSSKDSDHWSTIYRLTIQRHSKPWFQLNTWVSDGHLYFCCCYTVTEIFIIKMF